MFVQVVTTDGLRQLVNVDCIETVDEVSEGYCVIKLLGNNEDEGFFLIEESLESVHEQLLTALTFRRDPRSVGTEPSAN